MAINDTSAIQRKEIFSTVPPAIPVDVEPVEFNETLARINAGLKMGHERFNIHYTTPIEDLDQQPAVQEQPSQDVDYAKQTHLLSNEVFILKQRAQTLLSDNVHLERENRKLRADNERLQKTLKEYYDLLRAKEVVKDEPAQQPTIATNTTINEQPMFKEITMEDFNTNDKPADVSGTVSIAEFRQQVRQPNAVVRNETPDADQEAPVAVDIDQLDINVIPTFLLKEEQPQPAVELYVYDPEELARAETDHHLLEMLQEEERVFNQNALTSAMEQVESAKKKAEQDAKPKSKAKEFADKSLVRMRQIGIDVVSFFKSPQSIEAVIADVVAAEKTAEEDQARLDSIRASFRRMHEALDAVPRPKFLKVA